MLDQLGVEVQYYGDALPDGILLAAVRTGATSFFCSGGLGDSSPNNLRARAVTVGPLPSFVNKYNVR